MINSANRTSVFIQMILNYTKVPAPEFRAIQHM